jgi:hypothetical protein
MQMGLEKQLNSHRVLFVQISKYKPLLALGLACKYLGVADLQYEKLNMQVIETSIHKAWGFTTNFFHTLIKQRQKAQPIRRETPLRVQMTPSPFRPTT